jgi:hypothetical protein
MQYMRLNKQQQIDFLAELASMPNYLEQAFADLTPDDRTRNGVDGSFSPIEHIWHLADLEQQGFAVRIHRLKTEICPALEDFEGARIAREGHYKQRSWTRGFETFRDARSANLSTLRSLDKEQWLRRGTQQGVGDISICDMPSLMSEHDDAHRSEIGAWLDWLKTTR